jgi:Spy/CpxP family protein refolding chaperone
MRLSRLLAGFALPLALTLPGVALAQQPAPNSGAMAGAAMNPQQMQAAVKTALESCNLTRQQKRQIAPMVQNYKSETANADAATKQSAQKALLKNIYGVLTPAQQSQFKASLHASIQQAKSGGASQ